MSNSLQAHGLHHARPPCPSPSPKVCSNSYPLSQWCHLSMPSFVVAFTSCLQSFPASGSFPIIWLFSSTTGEGNGIPLQYSCLETPIDRGAWWATVHGVTKSRTWLSDFTFTVHFHALEKDIATHSSVLAWRIPGTGEPSGLPSMGSHRVGHDWSDLAAAAAAAW